METISLALKVIIPTFITFFIGVAFGWSGRTIKAEIEMDEMLSKIKNIEDKWKI